MLSIEFTQMGLKNQLRLQNELLTTSNELNNDLGFVESYFKVLPFFKNQSSAFMFVNVLHFKKYNAFKFLSYKDFKKFKNGKHNIS